MNNDNAQQQVSKHIFKINTDLVTQSILWIHSTISIFYKILNENNDHTF